MQRHIEFSEDEYYHAYNRGVEKRDIFLDDSDRERFLMLLYLCNGTKAINIRTLKVQGLTFEEFFHVERNGQLTMIGAYCLMPNHFHLLLKEHKELGISEFMHKLMTSYTMYFNKKYKRVGPLFQGAFKAEHADSDEYLLYLYSYIHLNPVKLIDRGWDDKRIVNPKKAEKYIASYQYSSFRDYAFTRELRAQAAILDPKEFPDYFEDSIQFKNIHNEWLNFDQGTTLVNEIG